MTMTTITTSNEKIDHVFGRLRRGDFGYVVGEPGVGKTLLLYKMMHAYAAVGRQCIFVSTSESLHTLVSSWDAYLLKNVGRKLIRDFLGCFVHFRSTQIVKDIVESAVVSFEVSGSTRSVPVTIPSDLQSCSALFIDDVNSLDLHDDDNLQRPAVQLRQVTGRVREALSSIPARSRPVVIGSVHLRKGATIDTKAKHQVDFVHELARADKEKILLRCAGKNRRGSMLNESTFTVGRKGLV